ncbi:MAG: hypothetical protein ABIQ88_18095 [Chitinophagaceae bacterium]
MKIFIYFGLLISGSTLVYSQDSTLLKKRLFSVVASDFDNGKTKGWLANINDTAIQISYLPARFARTAAKPGNIIALNYNLLTAVRIKRSNAGLRGLGTGFICGFALGGIIGFASGDDKAGIVRFSAGENALAGGLLAGILSAGIGAIIGALPGRKFIIGGKKENFDQLRFNVMGRAYRNN